MKWRNRKKVSECSHYYYDHFMVTDDPYPIYDSEEYCKIRWRELQEKAEANGDGRPNYCEICAKCKHFTVSRPNIRRERGRRKEMKENERYWRKREREAFRKGIIEQDPFKMVLDDIDLPF